jgi:hypothetical protein
MTDDFGWLPRCGCVYHHPAAATMPTADRTRGRERPATAGADDSARAARRPSEAKVIGFTDDANGAR